MKTMKFMKTSFYTFLWLSALVFTTGCGDDGPSAPPPTEAELRTAILTAGTGKWNIPATGAVMLGEGATAFDITDLFENFSITFTTTGYTTTGTTPVWARSGTWAFTNDSGTVFKREDDLEVSIVEISNTTLKVSLEWTQTTYDDGRGQSYAGKHTFTFAK